MVGLSGLQVGLLCGIAFVAGAGTTWLLFGRRPRRRQLEPLPATEIAPWAPDRAVEHAPLPAPPPVVPPVVEPALANLDTHGSETSSRRAGSAAAGALDRLGVGGARSRDDGDRSDEPDLAGRIPAQGGVPASGLGVPEQGGPVDGQTRGQDGGPR